MASDYLNFYWDCDNIPGDCPAEDFYTPGHYNLIFICPGKAPATYLSALLPDFLI
jgi:hypothetical protein